ncbi:hypothetical protein H4219_003093 [Mycoemilia scoparia]|uniref:Pentacotripeptide-repeat region of PRORP domain-containing protein n=1 Tax=Mycoemilia scoparia TaxID=417184 RepID=A0A9W7ZVS6_9FUNG|nr:hypothetical protein H4219_003093 [Mycoemilia scoparia]
MIHSLKAALQIFRSNKSKSNADKVWDSYRAIVKGDPKVAGTIDPESVMLLLRSIRKRITKLRDPVRAVQQSQQVWHDLKSARPLRPLEYSQFINSFAQAKRFDLVDKCLEQAKSDNLDGDHDLQSTILFAELQRNNIDKAMSIFEQLKKNNKVNIYQYTMLLSYYFTKKDIKKLFEVYDLLMADGIRPNIVVYSTMAHACISHENNPIVMARFSQVLSDMSSWNIHPNKKFINEIAEAYIKVNRFELVEPLVDRIVSSGGRIPLGLYHSWVKALALDKRFDKIQAVMEQVKNAQYQLNPWFLVTLIRIFSRAKMFDKATEYYKQLNDMNINTTTSVANVIVDYHLRCAQYHMSNQQQATARDQVAKGCEYADSAIRNNTLIDPRILAWLQGFTKSLLGSQKAKQLFDTMLKSDYQVGSDSYREAIQLAIAQNDFEGAVSMFHVYLDKLVKESKTRKFLPKHCLLAQDHIKFYGILTDTYGFEATLTIFETMEQIKLPHLALPYDILISRALDIQKIESIYTLTKGAVQYNCYLRPKTISRIFRLFYDHKEWVDIDNLFKYLERTNALSAVTSLTWSQYLESCLSDNGDQCSWVDFEWIFVKATDNPKFHLVWAKILKHLISHNHYGPLFRLLNLPSIHNIDNSGVIVRDMTIYLLRHLRDTDNFESAIEVWKWVLGNDSKVDVDPTQYNLALSTLASKNPSEKSVLSNRLWLVKTTLEKMYNSIKSKPTIEISSKSFLHVAGFFARYDPEGPKTVNKILQIMEDFGMKPNIAIYTTIMDGYFRQGRRKEAIRVIEMAGKLDLKRDRKSTISGDDNYGIPRYSKDSMNIITYTAILHSLAREIKSHDDQYVQVMLDFFSTMKIQGNIPNAHTYSVLLQAFVQSRDTKRFDKIVQDMYLHGVSNDIVISSQVLNNLTTKGNIHNILDFFSAIVNESHLSHARNTAYITSTSILANRDRDYSYNHSQMPEKKMSPAASYNSTKHLLIIQSRRILNIEIRPIYQRIKDINSYLLKNLLNSLALHNNGRHQQRHLSIQQQIKKSMLYMYNIMISYYVSNDDYKSANLLLKSLRDLNISPNVVTYTIFLQHIAASTHHNLAVIKKTPTETTTTTTIVKINDIPEQQQQQHRHQGSNEIPLLREKNHIYQDTTPLAIWKMMLSNGIKPDNYSKSLLNSLLKKMYLKN